MKKFLLINIAMALLPVVTFAQKWDTQVPEDGFAYASMFAGNFSLILSIVIGIIATFIVLWAAKKMGGGLFGAVLNLIGIGMLFIVLGTVSMVVDSWFVGLWFNIANIFFFATGYIFMVLGGNKLLKGIMNT